MKIKILSVGKKHDQVYLEAIEDYLKRLSHYTSTNFVLLPPCKNGSLPTSSQKIDEGERILKSINEDEKVVLLDETGRLLSSTDVSLVLKENIESGQDMVFIIGGAFGVSPDVFKRADLVFSLSKLVFPHMMVRLILTETLYRSMTILNNGKYHHF